VRCRALRALAAMCTPLAALALTGCGLVGASAPTALQLQVTRDFGAHVLYRSGQMSLAGNETVLGFLRHYANVGTSDGGRLVTAIGGLSAGRDVEAEHPAEWSYYVNGVSPGTGAASTAVNPGDHIWWDLHAAGQAPHIPAVVGSFPEPFLNGLEGKRLPVRIECTSDSAEACRTVTDRLRGFGVPAAVAAVGSGGAPEALRLLVGPWPRLGVELAAQNIGRGPGFSGVYSRFSANGQTLALLDAEGRAVRTLSRDAGLIAATRGAKEAPLWVVTGTDAAGVELAARAFDRASLEDRFAVALEPGGAIALPAPAPVPAPGPAPSAG
jgi:hypothetical protein